VGFVTFQCGWSANCPTAEATHIEIKNISPNICCNNLTTFEDRYWVTDRQTDRWADITFTQGANFILQRAPNVIATCEIRSNTHHLVILKVRKRSQIFTYLKHGLCSEHPLLRVSACVTIPLSYSSHRLTRLQYFISYSADHNHWLLFQRSRCESTRWEIKLN
jgi:hypothetical protein